MTMAMAGSGTTNVASGAAAFGNAMGLGAGLGRSTDRLAIPATAISTTKTPEQRIAKHPFSGSLSKMRREAAQAQMSKDRMALGAGDGGSLPLAYETAISLGHLGGGPLLGLR